MTPQVSEQHPLRVLFREATDWAFTHGQFPEPEARDARLKGYLSDDLLVRFLHVDRLYRLRDARGRPLADVAEMLLSGEAAGVSPELRALAVQRHIGDYTLFITGLFPESLERNGKVCHDVGFPNASLSARNGDGLHVVFPVALFFLQHDEHSLVNRPLLLPRAGFCFTSSMPVLFFSSAMLLPRSILQVHVFI